MEKNQNVYVLTGACCTGKSSIYDHYEQQASEDFVTLNEAAREFFEHNTIPTHERGTLETQMRIQDFFLSKYDAASRSGASTLLADGSPLCCAAYATLGSESYRDTLYDRIKDTWLPRATHFLLMNSDDIPYTLDTTDKVRQETPEQRELVQKTIRHLLEKSGAPFTVVSGNLDTRLAQVDSILQR